MRAAAVLAALAIAAVVAGCARYQLVGPERRDIGDFFSVEPQIEWSALSEGDIEVWTVNGAGLEAVYFAKGIEDGDPFFEAETGEKDEKRPTFRAHMTANEAMECVVDTLGAVGAGAVRATRLRPATFGAHPGFRFDLDFLNQSGLEKRGVALGAVVEGRLYLLLYIAAGEHYFGAYQGHVERMIESLDTL